MRTHEKMIVAASLAIGAIASGCAEPGVYTGFQLSVSNAPPPPQVVFVDEPRMVMDYNSGVYVLDQGDAARFDFPRSMLHSGDYHFSFSGLKTAVRYLLPKLFETHFGLPPLPAGVLEKEAPRDLRDLRVLPSHLRRRRPRA